MFLQSIVNSFNKDYIAGKYGAISSIGSLDDLKELINGK